MTMTPFFSALALVFLAELGDKTQLLVMAFAARYNPWTVLAGALSATALTHLIAVAAGGALTAIIPMDWIRIAAGGAFILFGLWTLKPEGREEKGEGGWTRRNPFLTVAGAFLLAEMGDKTQLAAMALAAEYRAPVSVWVGAVLGMALVDGIAVVVGTLLHRRIPEKAVKLVAAAVFIGFGLWTLWGQLR